MASAAYILCITIFVLLACATQGRTCSFETIYQFGDSIADTGNLIRRGAVGASSNGARLPYGETYFNRPTGRFSDGRIMLDYIAMASQLPFLNPYLDKGAEFNHGVNFAVAGSTALNSSFFAARNLHVPSTNSPLSIQLNWFRTFLHSRCTTPADCAAKLRRSLIMMGEIGGNDYNYGFFQGKTIQEIYTYVPYVVGAITSAAREVLRMGAVQVVVPGNFPIGCFPIYLTSFPTGDPRAYDDMGCLGAFNGFAIYHNNYLQRALALLRQEFPLATIHYADYYTAFQSVLRRSPSLGFDQRTALRACCGTGGPYNYDGSRTCGSPGVAVCPNPSQYISWDGVHLTQEAYRHMSEFLTRHICSNHTIV